MPAKDAVIVAGGRGTRLWPLTNEVPKPLVEFCGEPFLSGVIRRLAAAGVDRVLLVVGKDTGPFASLEPLAAELGIELEAVPEPAPLDTAGGIRSIAHRLRGPVLVLNGDILTDLDVEGLVARHEEVGATATLALTRVQDTSAFGVCVREGTRITAFVEKPAPGTLPGQDAVNAGTYVLDPAALLRFDEGSLSFERTVFPGLVADGEHVEGWVWEGAWADLGTPERYVHGHALALEGALRWPSVDAVAAADGGVRVHPSATVAADATLVGPVLLQQGATVGAGSIVGPNVVVGRDASVGAGSHLTSSVLGARTIVGAGVVAEQLLTGADAKVADEVTADRAVVGPGEHVARGVVMAPGTTVPKTP